MRAYLILRNVLRNGVGVKQRVGLQLRRVGRCTTLITRLAAQLPSFGKRARDRARATLRVQ